VLAARAEGAAHVDAVAVGQVEVEQHEVARRRGQGGGGGRRVLHLVTAPLQHRRHHRRDPAVVLHEKYPHRLPPVARHPRPSQPAGM
jgi:hypothetical protein